MAYYYPEPSHTFSEYLLVPGYTAEDCVPDNVSLKTPLVRYRKGQEECPISLNIPMVSAIMQSVSNDTLAIALAKEGGLSFIFGSQSIESEAEMVRRVKSSKAGFVPSASNLTPEHTLADVLALKEENGFSTVAVTEDATPNGKLLGIVTSRDYRVSRMSTDVKVHEFMTPREKLITAPASTTLKEANDIIWEHKLNALPIVDENDHLLYFVFRKDYAEHKEHPLALQDGKKRYLVGAGINSRDYRERIPALVEAGADVLCIDSSEGYSVWQKKVIDYVRENYGSSVKIGADNRLRYRTIGDLPPKGICGSGILDLIAEGFLSGWIDSAGRLQKDASPCIREVWEEDRQRNAPAIIYAYDGNVPLYFTQDDIGEFLTCKAAAHTMVATMLQSVNVSPAEIGTFYLAGGFGTHYDLESAITVGLYPDLPREKFRILGNSSLAGARRLLLNRSCRARLERIRALATYVQFGEMEKFVENMHAARFLPHTDASLYPSVKRRV